MISRSQVATPARMVSINRAVGLLPLRCVEVHGLDHQTDAAGGQIGLDRRVGICHLTPYHRS
jgi:hypothetical protein